VPSTGAPPRRRHRDAGATARQPVRRPARTSAPKPADKAVERGPAGAGDLVCSVPVWVATQRPFARDLGLKVTLIERWPVLGGVCLNDGCIPSKALLHAAR